MSDVIVPLSRGHSPSTSMTLLGMANAGDCEAWDRIVFLYSPLVDRWCRARKLNPDVIQGIGQEVFLTLFRNLGRFRKDEPGQGFRPWLWTITKNKIADHFIQIRDEPRCVGGNEAARSPRKLSGCRVDVGERGWICCPYRSGDPVAAVPRGCEIRL